jgi:hypothetical protein
VNSYAPISARIRKSDNSNEYIAETSHKEIIVFFGESGRSWIRKKFPLIAQNGHNTVFVVTPSFRYIGDILSIIDF